MVLHYSENSWQGMSTSVFTCLSSVLHSVYFKFINIFKNRQEYCCKTFWCPSVSFIKCLKRSSCFEEHTVSLIYGPIVQTSAFSCGVFDFIFTLVHLTFSLCQDLLCSKNVFFFITIFCYASARFPHTEFNLRLLICDHLCSCNINAKN